MKNPLLTGGMGALSLFLGFPNPLLHLPLLAPGYPLALCLLGKLAPSRASAFRQGWLTGLTGASAALYWLAIPVHTVGGLPWLLAVPCALAIGAYVGCFGGLFCLGAHSLRAQRPWVRACLLGLVWYALEALRGSLFSGFPWLTLASAFAPWPVAVQFAAVSGVYLLGGILTASICLLAEPSRPCRTAAILALAGLLLFGLVRMETTADTEAESHRISAFFVEGNIDQNIKWTPALQQTTVERYLGLSETALQDYTGPPPLIIWPETALPFFYQSDFLHSPRIRNVAARHHSLLLLGAPGARRSPHGVEVFNRAYLIDAQGNDRGFYDKEHLVPFGEYLPPLPFMSILEPLLQGVGGFTPGQSSQPLRAEQLALGMLICYESIFPELAQKRVEQGATVLVNISNDGWFGDTSAPEQHLQLAALRAVEQNRWLLRGTNTGISCIVDNAGRIVLRGGQFREQVTAGQAWTLTKTTWFHVCAPWIPPGALCCTLLLLCVPVAPPSRVSRFSRTAA